MRPVSLVNDCNRSPLDADESVFNPCPARRSFLEETLGPLATFSSFSTSRRIQRSNFWFFYRHIHTDFVRRNLHFRRTCHADFAAGDYIGQKTLMWPNSVRKNIN